MAARTSSTRGETLESVGIQPCLKWAAGPAANAIADSGKQLLGLTLILRLADLTPSDLNSFHRDAGLQGAFE
jgi:hypothetical protein